VFFDRRHTWRGLTSAPLLIFGVACAVAGRGSAQPDACAGVRDLLLTNGSVHTLDDADRVVESVRIVGDRIAATGEGRLGASRCTEIVELGGRAVVPGLIDNHNHIVLLGLRPRATSAARRSKNGPPFRMLADSGIPLGLSSDARRLCERGVKYITLFGMGWDHHVAIKQSFPARCREVDQPSAALVLDLKQRGLLDDTLVMFGSEFGRTPFSQGHIDNPLVGRDHHGGCFTWWFAGGGVKAGSSYGKTDDFAYSVIESPVHIHDLNATLLHILGIDHERLTFRFQGRDYRLTDVHGKVVEGILA
jgi:hypothetical protein